MARGSRLAAGAREEHEVLPALGGSRKHGERRWDPEHNRTRSGEGGSIHLRSKRRGTHSGRAAVLRTFPPSRAGTARSEQGGITQRRADLYDATIREGPGGHRACFAGLVCEQLGGGYGFYGESWSTCGRTGSRKILRRESYDCAIATRKRSRSLPRLTRCMTSRWICGRPVTCSWPGTSCDWKFPAATFRGSTAI